MVTSTLYTYLQIYVPRVRLQFAAHGKDALFIKVDGHTFRPGTIGKCASEFFHQAGIRKDIRVTATNIRKMVSDKAYEMSRTKKRLFRAHMKHQERMANANYVIKFNADRASWAHELVHNIIQEHGDSQPQHQAHTLPWTLMMCPMAWFLLAQQTHLHIPRRNPSQTFLMSTGPSCSLSSMRRSPLEDFLPCKRSAAG